MLQTICSGLYLTTFTAACHRTLWPYSQSRAAGLTTTCYLLFAPAMATGGGREWPAHGPEAAPRAPAVPAASLVPVHTQPPFPPWVMAGRASVTSLSNKLCNQGITALVVATASKQN